MSSKKKGVSFGTVFMLLYTAVVTVTWLFVILRLRG